MTSRKDVTWILYITHTPRLSLEMPAKVPIGLDGNHSQDW